MGVSGPGQPRDGGISRAGVPARPHGWLPACLWLQGKTPLWTSNVHGETPTAAGSGPSPGLVLEESRDTHHKNLLQLKPEPLILLTVW